MGESFSLSPARATDAILRFVSRTASGISIAFSCVTDSLITGKNLNTKVLEKIHRIMVKKHQMLVPEFDLNSVEESLSKFKLALLENVGQETFEELYDIRTKVNLDVFKVIALLYQHPVRI